MRVRLLTLAAGPDFGPHDIGTVLDVPEPLAYEWFRLRHAEPVDIVLPSDFFAIPEQAVSTVNPETAVLKRGPGRPRGT